MNIFNDLPTAFPWYDNVQKQNRFKLNVKSDDWAGLITPQNALLPFEYCFDPGGAVTIDPVAEWKIYRLDDTLAHTIDAGSYSLLHMTTKEGRIYVYYGGEGLTETGPALNMPAGFYYSKIRYGVSDLILFSEVFYVPECSFMTTSAADQIPFLKLEWYNNSDLRPIFYNDIVSGVPRFRNVVYLDTFVHQSEPEIIEDGEKDGNDETIATFIKCLLKYRITEFVPDYLKLALVVMQMHDVVKLTTPFGLRSGAMHKVTTNSQTEQGGAFSNVDIVFEEDVAMIKKACADNMA